MSIIQCDLGEYIVGRVVLWRVDPRLQTTVNIPQHPFHITGKPCLLRCLYTTRTTLCLPRCSVSPRKSTWSPHSPREAQHGRQQQHTTRLVCRCEGYGNEVE